MAKISDIIFCLRATNTEGEGASANTILSAITPEYIPGLFSFSVVITLLDFDFEKCHEFDIIFASPSDEAVVTMHGDLPTIEENSNLPPEHKGITIAMDWNNVNFKSSGIYTIKIYLDGSLIREKRIFVKGRNE